LAKVRAPNPAFEAALDEVRRADALEARSFVNPLVSASPPTGGAAIHSGSHLDQALDWIAELDDASVPDDPVSSDDSVEGVASELGLSTSLTREDLNRARRRFMWRNHPDRRAEIGREIANRRVAIANMLIDRAQAALGGRKPK
jgi:hypothetical protein